MEKKKEVKSKKKTAKKVAVKKEEKVVTPVKEEKVTTKETVKETVKEVASKKNYHGIFIALLVSLAVAIVLTWIIPTGYFSGAELVTNSVSRVGINEAFLALFYGANYYLVQIFFILVLGLFYGIISKTAGYKKMVQKIAKLFKGREKLFVLINTLILALMSSMFTQVLPILIFVPLIISVAKELKISKLNAIALTFGAIMVGMMGTTFGTYGVDYIHSYMATTAKSGLVMRFGILAIGYILLNILIILSMNKKKANEEELEEVFELKEDSKDGKSWAYFLLFGIILVIVILGFTPWLDSFGIKAFDNFNTWLTTKVKIGDHAIFGYILGSVPAFGKWDVFTFTYVLMILALIVKLAAKIKFSDAVNYAVDGIKKMIKPAILIVFAYAMFVISYNSGITAWIIDKLNGTNFNVFTNALGNAITSFMHVDFGYSGFSLGAFYAAKYADNVSTILAIMTSMNGLVSFFVPTSVLLLVGTSMYDVSYKSWIKYIWKFLVAMLVILLLVFVIM